MGIIKQLQKLVKYHSSNIRPQVDPDHMRPIFENVLKQMSFYSPEDSLNLWKDKENDLFFMYESKVNSKTNMNKHYGAYGVIIAQERREHFEDVDLVSVMRINTLFPDSKGEIHDALKTISEDAGIGKLIAYPSIGVLREDVIRLYESPGIKRLEDYSLG